MTAIVVDVLLVGFCILFAGLGAWVWLVTRKENLMLYADDSLAALESWGSTPPVATMPGMPSTMPRATPTPYAPHPIQPVDEHISQLPGLDVGSTAPPTGEQDSEAIPDGRDAGGPSARQTMLIRPTPESFGFLVMERGDHPGRNFALDAEGTTIGREGTNDIVVDDGTISRQQAKIKQEGQSFYLYDMAASNPTLLNGRPVKGRVHIEDGDRIEMGGTVFVFKQIRPVSGSSGMEESISQGYQYSRKVYGQVPSRMYEGDSSIVVVTVAPRLLPPVVKSPKKYKFIESLSFLSAHVTPELEVELLVGGFDISGERKQRKLLYPDRPTSFYWNVSPPRSGTFELGFVFRAEVLGGSLEDILFFTTQIVVTKYDGLTNNQARFLAGASGAGAAVLGVAEVLNKLGVFAIR